MVLDAALINYLHYKVRIKVKVEEPREPLPLHLGVVAIEKGVFGSPSTIVANFAYLAIGLMSRVFVNGPGDRRSIPGRVIPKTQKIGLDAAFLNNQHYKVRIKDNTEQTRKWSSALLYASV